MYYAIISPHRDEPWAYLHADTPPSIEEMADIAAEVEGFADRDEWATAYNNPFIGWAQVH